MVQASLISIWCSVQKRASTSFLISDLKEHEYLDSISGDRFSKNQRDLYRPSLLNTDQVDNCTTVMILYSRRGQR